LPRHEQYGLVSHLRRAAVSIPANIAEGHGSFYRGNYIAALSVAYSELMELETLGEAAIRRKYVRRDKMTACFDRCGEVGGLINALARSLGRESRTREQMD